MDFEIYFSTVLLSTVFYYPQEVDNKGHLYLYNTLSLYTGLVPMDLDNHGIVPRPQKKLTVHVLGALGCMEMWICSVGTAQVGCLLCDVPFQKDFI